MRAAAAAIAGDVTVIDRDDKLSAASATSTPASVCAAWRRESTYADRSVTPVHLFSNATPNVTATPTIAVTTADIIGRKVSIIGPAAIADAVVVIEISYVS
jgi:hypothetical protein